MVVEQAANLVMIDFYHIILGEVSFLCYLLKCVCEN